MRAAWSRLELADGITAWRGPGDAGDRLGEGPLWHPLRAELFWCDIEGSRLHSLDPVSGEGTTIPWPCRPSALGWIDGDTLLVADESGLQRLSLGDLAIHPIAAFPAGTGLRSNDGRADPWGGFWIGMMDPDARHAAGALWRWTLVGGLRCLREGVSVPNATSFAGRARAFFADSATRVIEAAALDLATGDPIAWTPFAETLPPAVPDGAAIDAEGFLWNAEWDGARLVRYAPDGRVDRELRLPVPRPTCPAFGGPGLRTLFVTTARSGLSDAALGAAPISGALLAIDGAGKGLAEPQVRL